MDSRIALERFVINDDQLHNRFANSNDRYLLDDDDYGINIVPEGITGSLVFTLSEVVNLPLGVSTSSLDFVALLSPTVIYRSFSYLLYPGDPHANFQRA